MVHGSCQPPEGVKLLHDRQLVVVPFELVHDVDVNLHGAQDGDHHLLALVQVHILVSLHQVKLLVASVSSWSPLCPACLKTANRSCPGWLSSRLGSSP